MKIWRYLKGIRKSRHDHDDKNDNNSTMTD